MTEPKAPLHAFVDESKANAYILATVLIPAYRVDEVRSNIVRLRHSGARTIHMRKEGRRSRNRIVDGMVGLGLESTIYVAKTGPELARRAACFATMYQELAAADVTRVVIEQDDSVITHDRRVMRHLSHGAAPFEYTWLHRADEPLLWAADTMAWCFAQGGHWRQRASSLVTRVDAM